MLTGIFEKRCSSICKEIKPISSFRVSSRGTGYRGECNDCRNRIRRERKYDDGKTPSAKSAKTRYRKSARGKAIARYGSVQRKYSLSPSEYDALLRRQQNRCRICRCKFSGDVLPHVDHCHATKRVRGLLCGYCNKGLGHFHDDPALLRRAARYILRAQNRT